MMEMAKIKPFITTFLPLQMFYNGISSSFVPIIKIKIRQCGRSFTVYINITFPSFALIFFSELWSAIKERSLKILDETLDIYIFTVRP